MFFIFFIIIFFLILSSLLYNLKKTNYFHHFKNDTIDYFIYNQNIDYYNNKFLLLFDRYVGETLIEINKLNDSDYIKLFKSGAELWNRNKLFGVGLKNWRRRPASGISDKTVGRRP